MSKKYRELNKEEKKAYHKAYYEAHKEEMKKASNENYYANKDREAKRRKEYYAQNKDKLTAKTREYYHKHKEENKEYRREYSRTHRKETKNRSLLRYYGINLEQYNIMYDEQEGKCFTCKTHHKDLVVDHNHNTGKVRKLLCNKCNLALGYVKDNVEILQSMIVYLEQER